VRASFSKTLVVLLLKDFQIRADKPSLRLINLLFNPSQSAISLAVNNYDCESLSLIRDRPFGLDAIECNNRSHSAINALAVIEPSLKNYICRMLSAVISGISLITAFDFRGFMNFGLLGPSAFFQDT